MEPVFTGNEKWIKEGLNGATVWARPGLGDWWPVYDIELDCGLMKIDVCGKTQVISARESDIKVGHDGETIEDIYEEKDDQA